MRLLLVLLAATALGETCAARAEPPAPRGVVRGFVRDAEGGGPLPGALVVVYALPDGGAPAGTPVGAAANGDGLYEIGPVEAGRYAIRVSLVGYASVADTLVVGERPVTVYNARLSPAAGALGEVVVTGRPDRSGGVAQDGVQTIGPADLASVPTPGASGDLANYLTMLPSVVSAGDTGGNLYVRGGTPSQNLVLVDGAPVFQPFHLLSAFSAFPEAVVGSVDFYAGGFGVRYNGRTSSVLDVTTRSGRTDRLEAAAEAGPFVVGGLVEGPIRRGSSSFLVSARRSVVASVAPTLLGRDVPIAFSDVLVKLATLDAGGTCSVTGLYTRDRGRVDAALTDEFGWTNGLLGTRCLLAPSSTALRFETNASITYARNLSGTAGAPERSSDVYLINFDLDVERATGFGRLRYGGFGRYILTSYTLAEPNTRVRTDDEAALTAGGYAEATVALGPRLSATAGALVSAPPRGTPTVEPRGRLSWSPGGDRGPAFTASGGVYRQSLLGIQDERDAGNSFTVWIPPPLGDADVAATHALVGVSMPVGAFRLGAEAYAKRTRRQPVPIVSGAAQFTTTLTRATVSASGAEARAEYRRGAVYGFLAYGYGNVEYRSPDGSFGTILGAPVAAYRPPHDRRHQVTALASVARGPWSASVRWQFGSGLPFTQLIGFDEAVPPVGYPDFVEGNPTTRVLFDRPFGGRLPAVHRLDAQVARRIRLGAVELTVNGGVVNAYDRANVLYFDVYRLRRVDQLPVIPYVAVRLGAGR